MKALRAKIDGRDIDVAFPGKCKLAIFPAAIEIQGEVTVEPELDYTVVFLDPAFVSKQLKEKVSDSVVAFQHERLSQSLLELSTEAASADNMFGLLSEGWAIQALAHIYRVSTRSQQKELTKAKLAGLSSRCLSHINEYLDSNLGRPITLRDLAGIAGLSNRHFLRAFQQSMGATPYAYVLTKRVEETKHRLATTSESIIEIALATGFGSAQHFSTAFKKATGLTPSAYRRTALQ